MKPADSFEKNGYRFDSYALAGRRGELAGHVTVRPLDGQRVVRRWMVQGEHATIGAFILAARRVVLEELVAGALVSLPSVVKSR